MNFFYKKAEIETGLTISEITAIMLENTERYSAGRKINFTKYFHGFINEDRFVLTRLIKRKNIFMPILTGSILSSDGRSKISLNIKPNFLTIGFTLILFIIIFFIMSAPLINHYFSGMSAPDYKPPFVSIIFMTVLFFTVYISGFFTFNYETEKALNFLNKILQK